MLVAIDIIAENIPDLEALNLNDNKLHGLDHLKILSTKLKHLKILYMGDNRVSTLVRAIETKFLLLVNISVNLANHTNILLIQIRLTWLLPSDKDYL